MNCKFFVCMALCGLSSIAHAQQPVGGFSIEPFAGSVNPAVVNPGAPAGVPQVQAPSPFASPYPTTGAYAIGAGAAGPSFSGPTPVTNQYPYPVVPSTIVHPIPVAPGAGSLSAIAPLPTTAATSTWVQSAPSTQPQVTRQTHIYTPTYYYYYYQQPYQVTQVSPVYATPVMPNPYAYGNGYESYGDIAGGYQAAGWYGPMMNGRGEMGHIRLPYYSYRRPWYYPGQPSFNVTIPGPVW